MARIKLFDYLITPLDYGGTLNLASAVTAGEHRLWKMKQQHKTPGYMTRWEGLAEVR